MILFIIFSFVSGNLPACENHSKKNLTKKLDQLEKTYAVHKCRKELKNFSNNKNVLKMYDETSHLWLSFKKEELEKLLSGVKFAAQKHQAQTRKDAAKTPYIIHPIGVSRILYEEGNIRDIDILTAALLHDTLEDTETTIPELEQTFGEKVSSIVSEVTNDPNLSTEENKKRQVEHAPLMSHEARLVKLADRLYNVRDLKNLEDKQKVTAYQEWAKKLCHALQGTNQNLELALQTELK